MTVPEAQALQEYEIVRHVITGDFGKVAYVSNDKLWVAIYWNCGPQGDQLDVDLCHEHVARGMHCVDICQNPRFAKTFCSNCGREFGPGNHGFSHCKNHKGKFGVR